MTYVMFVVCVVKAPRLFYVIGIVNISHTFVCLPSAM
jgi:hypothetical protein